MRALLPGLALLSALSAAQAEEAKPVRVIPLTRESAEASAALIKSPHFGRPPMGRIVRQAEAPQPAARPKNWKDARAEVTGSIERSPEAPRARAVKRVEIWTSTASGSLVVKSYSVPATDLVASSQ
jgi:hypothetical protein